MTVAPLGAATRGTIGLGSGLGRKMLPNRGLPGFSRVHKLPLAVAEEAVLGPHFHIKPLLPILDDAGPFRLLAISAKHARFYQGARWTFAEVEGIDLPQGIGAIASITQYENTR